MSANISDIHEGSVIGFHEYRLEHGRRYESLSIPRAVVHEVWPANSTQSLETIERYYGEGLDPVTMRQLSWSNDVRLVLDLGTNQYGQMDVKVITLVPYFMETGLQDIDILGEQGNEPSYVDIMGRIYNG